MLPDLQLSSTDGAVVMSVVQGSPAFRAGLRQYDVITAINGESITGSDALTKRMQTAKVGESLKVAISRSGKSQDVAVTVGDKNAASAN